MTPNPSRPQAGFAFPISEQLYQATLQVIHNIQRDPAQPGIAPQLTVVVVEAVDVGLVYFLIYPLELAGVNRLTVNLARMAVQTARQAIHAVVRRIVPALSARQLQAIAGFLEACLVHPRLPE